MAPERDGSSPIDIRIDSLSVRGVANFDPERFGSALGSELTRLFSEGRAARGTGEWQVGQLHLLATASSDSFAMGVEVARAFYAQVLAGGPR